MPCRFVECDYHDSLERCPFHAQGKEAEDYTILDPDIEKQLREMGRNLKAQMPDGWGFALLMFTYGEGGSLFYLSSGERANMVKVMEEFIAREKKRLM